MSTAAEPNQGDQTQPVQRQPLEGERGHPQRAKQLAKDYLELTSQAKKAGLSNQGTSTISRMEKALEDATGMTKEQRAKSMEGIQREGAVNETKLDKDKKADADQPEDEGEVVEEHEGEEGAEAGAGETDQTEEEVPFTVRGKDGRLRRVEVTDPGKGYVPIGENDAIRFSDLVEGYHNRGDELAVRDKVYKEIEETHDQLADLLGRHLKAMRRRLPPEPTPEERQRPNKTNELYQKIDRYDRAWAEYNAFKAEAQSIGESADSGLETVDNIGSSAYERKETEKLIELFPHLKDPIVRKREADEIANWAFHEMNAPRDFVELGMENASVYRILSLALNEFKNAHKVDAAFKGAKRAAKRRASTIMRQNAVRDQSEEFDKTEEEIRKMTPKEKGDYLMRLQRAARGA